MKSIGGDPPDQDPVYSGWLWNELWTDDKGSSHDFYARLVGYQRRDVDLGTKQSYTVFGEEGKGRAGAVDIEIEGVEPHWLPYIAVEDPATVASRAENERSSRSCPPRRRR